MPIDGVPDPSRHRICRRCQKWFEPVEGRAVSPEVTGPLGAMEALRGAVTGDSSILRFQCNRCSRIRTVTQGVIWGTLAVLLVLVLILEKLGVLK